MADGPRDGFNFHADRDGGTPTAADQIWNIKTLLAKTGLSRSTVYKYVAAGIFPKPRQLGPRRVGWLAADVTAWMAELPPAKQEPAAGAKFTAGKKPSNGTRA